VGGRFLGVYGLRNEVDCIEDFAFYMGGVTGYNFRETELILHTTVSVGE
jgi:hypothetical protein